jgi:hypothetical protein
MNRNYRLVVRLTESEGKALAEAAQACGMTVSDMVRVVLFEMPKVKYPTNVQSHLAMPYAKKTQRTKKVVKL